MGNPGVNGEVTATSMGESLYLRIGGYEVIAAVVDDLFQRMLSGPHTWYHWKGLSADRRAAECGLYTGLVCSAAERPVESQGLDGETTNRGLGIGKVEWEYFVCLAAEALDDSSLGEWEKEELFCLLARSKAAVTSTEKTLALNGVFAAFPHELSEREKEVLRLVAMGNNNSEIAEELFISINTVTRHLTNIFAKTSTRNRVEAAVYAAKRHFV
ncbi:MAG: hypothetical protein IH963_07825 [Chloroflexi bacterium]|nr:hypothetical protein [Chloroflexota bacterium]